MKPEPAMNCFAAAVGPQARQRLPFSFSPAVITAGGMKTMRVVAVVVLFLPCWLQAKPIPSEVQSREWTDPHAPIIIRHSDKYIDYKRDGKTVFRVIDRVTHVKVKPTDPDDPKTTATSRVIEFVFDDKVFASVAFDDEGHMTPTLQVGDGVHFSAGHQKMPEGVHLAPDIPKTRSFFHVCVPKYDYYEYVEINNGKEVIAQKESDEVFAVRKPAFIKMVEKGYISTLSDDTSR
jgi:hypothetical protein